MGPRDVAQFLGQSPDWYKLALLVFLVVNPIIFHQPFYRRLVAGGRVHFHAGDGVKMLPTAAWRAVGYRSCHYWYDQRNACS